MRTAPTAKPSGSCKEKKNGKFSVLCGTEDAKTYDYTKMSLNGQIDHGYCRVSKVYKKSLVLPETYR